MTRKIPRFASQPYDAKTNTATALFDLSKADEVKRLIASKGHNTVTPYQGPLPAQTTLPSQTPTVAPVVMPPPASNPLVVPVTFTIVSADVKNAVPKVVYGGKEVTLKIEANPSGARGFTDSMRNLYRADGNFSSWRGAKAKGEAPLYIPALDGLGGKPVTNAPDGSATTAK